MDSILAGRELGEYPLSISTDAAIGSIIKEGLGNARHVWINLHTLFRNLHGAVDPVRRTNLGIPQWQQGLFEEVLQIQSLLAKHVTGELVFYFPSYEGVLRKYPRAQVRATTSKRIQEYALLASAVLRGFVSKSKDMQEQHQLRVESFDVDLKGFPPAAFIITHFAIDLLSCRSDTILLETHTAARKPQSQWNTKFVTENQLDMPFNRLTLQVFGDKTTFSPMPLKVKESLIKIAKERKWTPLTTKERVDFSLREMRDYVARDFFLSL